MEELYNKFKLLRHVDRLDDWQRGQTSRPIFAAFDLSDRCNNKCPKCVSVLTYGHGGGEIVSQEDAVRIINELGDYGIKAITFAGGGEPTCNPHLKEIIRLAKQKIGDVALWTNGLKLEDRIIDAVVDCCTWTRISLDADSPELYLKTHGMPGECFEKVVSNISKLTKTRNKKGRKENLTVGLTYLIGEHTINGIYPAAKLARELGVDYIRFRPFFIWEGNEMKLPSQEIEKINQELKRCEELRTSDFSPSYSIQRCNAMSELSERSFRKCYVPHFITEITADLKMYPCCILKNNPKYCLGDLSKNTFSEIWESEIRRNISEKINLKGCPNPCMYHNDAELLAAVKEPIKHHNFL